MEILKLVPCVKDYIWGGTRLRDEFGIGGFGDEERIAEAWVLSCHPDGRCRISGGEFDGMNLAGYFSKNSDAMGTRAKEFRRFPVMVKLIDARERLSVQVHPDDEYARAVRDDQGKAELCYVVDAQPDAELIYGFNCEMTQEQFRTAILDGTIEDSLEHIKVEKGDVFFIEPGTVHAIGEGVLIAEIQQNSNATYRIFDYGRTDAEGNPRPLHVDKAIDVSVTVPSFRRPGPERLPEEVDGRFETLLGSCEYFTARLMETSGKTHFEVDKTSFAHILMLSGEIKLSGAAEAALSKGDSAIVPAGFGRLDIDGTAEFIVTTI